MPTGWAILHPMDCCALILIPTMGRDIAFHVFISLELPGFTAEDNAVITTLKIPSKQLLVPLLA